MEKQSGAVDRGVLLRSLPGDSGNPLMLVLGWRDAAPPQSSAGDIVHATTSQVRARTALPDPDGELSLEVGTTVLVTVFEVGSVPADELLSLLDDATDRFLLRFPDVHEVAFAGSSDGRWVVEVLRTSGAEGMRTIQADRELRAHIQHMRASAASMEPTLNRVEKVVAPGDGRAAGPRRRRSPHLGATR